MIALADRFFEEFIITMDSAGKRWYMYREYLLLPVELIVPNEILFMASQLPGVYSGTEWTGAYSKDIQPILENSKLATKKCTVTDLWFKNESQLWVTVPRPSKAIYIDKDFSAILTGLGISTLRYIDVNNSPLFADYQGKLLAVAPVSTEEVQYANSLADWYADKVFGLKSKNRKK